MKKECQCWMCAQAHKNYVELMFRWLSAQRDFPFDRTPEPEQPTLMDTKGDFLDMENLRARIISEFNRAF